MLRNSVGKVLITILVILVLATVVGHLLGQPVLLSYVVTGSMEPTIETGDGFVVIPMVLADDVEEGDVIVFRAQYLQGGGLTTHRVVDETERGYITRGDANPYTDQEGVEPPVQDAQVVAKAWQVGGTVVIVPRLGTIATFIQDSTERLQRHLTQALGIRTFLGDQGLALLLFGLSGLAYLVDYLLTEHSSAADRTRIPTRDEGTSMVLVLFALALLVVAAATAAMVVPAGSHHLDIVSAEFESERPFVIPVGGSDSHELTVSNSGIIPVHVYFESPTRELEFEPSRLSVGPRATESVTVTVSTPDKTGHFELFFHEHRYLAVLPKPVVTELFEVHPLAPLVAVDVLLGGSVFALGSIVFGTNRVRFRTPERPSGRFSLKKLLKYLYR